MSNNKRETVSLDALSDSDKELVKEAVETLADSFTRVAAETDLQKTTLDDLAEETGVDKALVRKLAKVYYKRNFEEERDKHETFEHFYEELLSNSKGE